ncbi:MAG: ATP-binding protein [Cyanobacteria bacterium P01_H01_bin.105]
MDLQEATAILDAVMGQQALTKVQYLVFRQSWLGLSYREIAESTRYDVGYIKDSGYRLWKLLSNSFGQKVSKNNICSVLRKFAYLLEERYDADSGDYQHSIANAVAQRQGCLEKQTGIDTEVRSLSRLDNAGHVSRQDSETLCFPEFSADHICAIDHLTNLQEFVGRERELQSLEKWVLADYSKVISITGIVGIGKTALMAQFCNLHQAEFEHIVWLSLRHLTGADAICRSVVDQISIGSCTEHSNDHVKSFLDCVQNYRCLILIDDFDASSQTSIATNHIAEIFEEYAKLIALMCQVNHRSCLILIGREEPIEISIMQGYKLGITTLNLTGLEAQHVSGVIPCNLNHQTLEKLTEVYDGNPLFLNLAVSQVDKFFDGDFNLFKEKNKFIFHEIFNILKKQSSLLSANERKVLIYLCICPPEISFSDFSAIASKFPCFEYIADLDSLTRKKIVNINQSKIKVIPCFRQFILDMLSNCFFKDFMNFLTKRKVDHDSAIFQYPLYITHSNLVFDSNLEKASKYDSNTLFQQLIDKLSHCFKYELSLMNDITCKKRELKNRTYASRYSLIFLKNTNLIIDSLYSIMINDSYLKQCARFENFSHPKK